MQTQKDEHEEQIKESNSASYNDTRNNKFDSEGVKIDKSIT